MKKLFSVFVAVFMVCLMAVPTFAYTVGDHNIVTATEVMKEYEDTYPYAILVDENGAYWLYLFATKPVLNSSGTTLQQVEGGGWRSFKQAYTGDGWTQSATSETHFSVGIDWVTLSSFDIYNGNTLVKSSADNFFGEPPLAEMVLTMTEEEMVKVAVPEMVGAMKILVPCGVGLMALLVGLKLFGKRSLIFRS